MVIKKKSETFNVYTCEISYGQLETICAALEADHSNAIADETLAEIRWYLDRVPKPGEDEKEEKAKQDAGKGSESDGATEADGDLPIPMPPGSEAGTPPDTDEPMSRPPEPGDEDSGAEPDEPGGRPPLPEPGMEEEGGHDPLTAAAAEHRERTAVRAPRAEPVQREPAARREPAVRRGDDIDHRLPPPPRA